MDELGPGLYEALITEGLKAQLDAVAERLPPRVRALRAAEASHDWSEPRNPGSPR